MKTGSMLRIFALALALSLLLVLIPATPALALPEITISPGSGSVGTQVTVSGSGFESFAGTEINIFFDGVEIAASPLTVPENGTFSTRFEVPDGTDPGTTYVRVTTVIGGEVRKSFIVEKPEIELDIDVGAVGTMVTVEGRGFYAGGTIDLYYYRDGGRVSVGEEVAGDTGAFAYAFAVPDSTAGRHKIEAEDLLDNSDEANFEVIPAITVSPSSGAIGDELTVSGAGFGGNSDVTVYFSNVLVAESSANKYGSFEASFSVPALESGTYNTEAEDEDDNKAASAFTVASGATLSQTSGSVGTDLTVNGVGFKANTIVAVSYDDHQVATAATGGSGAFSVTFVVPPSPGGPHNVSITDGTNTATDIFIMETDSPPAPVLVSPEDDTRAEAMASFDWEDVSDASGVIYTLQVATKDSFAASYIVLEKAGLTDSDYTLTEEEKLEPSSKEAPHYWRVKAVDEAANESEWSDVGSFYVGSRFTLSETVKKVLIGLGIAGAGFLGFWLGRRTAYARRV
jgi:hypothetical protein